VSAEIWRLVPSDPTLEASSLGRVRIIPHTKRGRTYGGFATYGYWDGCRLIFVRRNHTTRKIARLVCEAFHGLPEKGQVCMHLDENSRNNKPDNLLWGSQKENLNAPGFIAYCQSRTGKDSPYEKGKTKLGI
jgi:hypothetical protein